MTVEPMVALETAASRREDLIRWAGSRRCLLCRERAALHTPTIIEGSRGKRWALIRSVGGALHEFDPGERRHDPRR